uniref:Mucolipin TRP cation channel 3 n=1 Tax=Cynoglossus semilaevis TaxID=244447 RepID=A0A3P8VZN6_CYNSE
MLSIDPAQSLLRSEEHRNKVAHPVGSKGVEDFRRRLKYFFMNPCEKYRARGRKPWKLMIQIVKIAIITIQLVTFGLSNEMMVTFKDENLMAFRHLFLKGYKDHGLGTYVLYTKADVYDRIYYIIDRFLGIQNLTVGNLAYERVNGQFTPLSLCQEFYRNSSIDPGNETFDIDPHIDKDCISVYPGESTENNNLASPFNLSLDFKRLLSVNVYLTLKTINLQTVRHNELPDCYDFHTMIMFDNRAHSGKIQVDVEYDVRIYECREWSVEGTCKSVTQTFTLAVTTELLIQPSHPSLRVANALHMHYKCKI